ncbi:MAG TPA: ABC transporter ATP-binding protein [Bacillota bacterium]|jgi:branched-chain amino acid transport system ATP-binding protein|nr:ABC transporter ATP-binding protein [Bacillota bacterium]
MSELVVTGLTKRFGGLLALNGVSFSVRSGEILGLIGPNGAGKTTLFNCLTGFLRIDGGSVEFDGRPITYWSPNRICALGIARTFQVVQVLQGMTVLENVMVGAYLRDGRTAVAQRRAAEVLDRVGMGDKADMIAVNLTLPAKKRLEVAMCLATGPSILMLDESMAGLTPTEIHESSAMIRSLRDEGMALVVVEHVMEAIMPIADRVMVLDSGNKIAEGAPAEIVRDPRVVSAYLGDKYAERIRC